MTERARDKDFPVSWDQFHRDCRALTWRLNEVGPFHAVIAITRGGLVPAAIVARELGVRIIDTVCIASYDHTKQGDLKVLKGISADTAALGGGTGNGCSRLLPRSSRSRCKTASMSRARTSATPLPCCHAARKRLASSRRQKKQGRWPAAKAVASSRTNSSVQLRPPITLRRQPLNSQTQVIHAGLDQRFFNSVFVAGSWMMPRLPVNRPRYSVATM